MTPRASLVLEYLPLYFLSWEIQGKFLRDIFILYFTGVGVGCRCVYTYQNSKHKHEMKQYHALSDSY